MTKFTQALHRSARAAAVAVALVALGVTANAQPKPSAAAMATAQQLVKITGAASAFQPLIPGVVEQAKLLFLQQNPDLASDLNAVAAELRKEYAPRVSELTDHVAELYARRFTEAEMKQILAFYSSPVGKKYQSQLPQIIQASSKFAHDWANKLSDEVIQKMREDMKKRGHPL
jgi:uncharacterized protein